MLIRDPAPARVASFTLEVPVQRITRLASSALFALVLLSACDTRVVTEPQYQLQVINLRNDFTFQAAGLEAFSDEVVYSWQSDGTAASVIQSPSVLTGTAMLFIADGAGAQVYQRSLGENGTFATTTGVPGNWTVRLMFSEASGTASFRVTKQ